MFSLQGKSYINSVTLTWQHQSFLGWGLCGWLRGYNVLNVADEYAPQKVDSPVCQFFK